MMPLELCTYPSNDNVIVFAIVMPTVLCILLGLSDYLPYTTVDALKLQNVNLKYAVSDLEKTIENMKQEKIKVDVTNLQLQAEVDDQARELKRLRETLANLKDVLRLRTDLESVD